MNDEQKLRLRSQIKGLVKESIAPLVNQVITQRLTQYAEYLHGELIPYPVTGQAAHHIGTLTELRDERGEVFIAEIDIEAIDFAIEAINARERALAAAPAPAEAREPVGDASLRAKELDAALLEMQDAAAKADMSNCTARESREQWARYDAAEKIVRRAFLWTEQALDEVREERDYLRGYIKERAAQPQATPREPLQPAACKDRLQAQGSEAQADAREEWRPMESAPTDGTLLRLLVRFDEHPTEDADESPTIGSNNRDHDGEDRWLFAGWNWEQDCYTQGKGTPIGWLPMLSATPKPAPEDTRQAQGDGR